MFGFDILILKKLMLYNIIGKKIQRIMGIFMVYVVYRACLYFWIALGLGLNQSKNVWNEFFLNDPPHMSCLISFENDSLSKC